MSWMRRIKFRCDLSQPLQMVMDNGGIIMVDSADCRLYYITAPFNYTEFQANEEEKEEETTEKWVIIVLQMTLILFCSVFISVSSVIWYYRGLLYVFRSYIYLNHVIHVNMEHWVRIVQQ